MFTDYQLILHHIRDAIFLLDKDGYFLYANPSAIALAGYQPDELHNKSFSILYHIPNDTIKMEYELNKTRKKGFYQVEGWKTRKDKTSFWAEISLNAIYDEGSEKKVTGFTCVLKDVTARKTNELELRKNEERFRLLVEGIRDYSVFMLDPEGYILTWNDGAKQINGYNSSEIIGKHFSIFYIQEDLDAKKHEMELRTASSTGKYEEEGWRVRKNGTVYWASIVLSALFNEQNKLIGFSKVTRDLTDRRESEETLRQSEERYRFLVEQVTDYGIFMMDEKGRIASWNEGAKRINGYSASEIIGKYFSIFYPEEDIINGKPTYELKIARQFGKYEEEGWRLRKDGSRFWASIVISAVYNNKGELFGFSKVTRDLSERKEAEKALRESYESYRNLTEELKITNEELSYANQELEQFTSIVSHDLQEPIRTIKSFLQLIDIKMSQEQYDDLKSYVDRSISAANRMKELIQNLLHYSQLSKGSLVNEEVKVDDIVNQAIQNLKSSIEANKAHITFEKGIEKISGDRIQLVQLVQNLLSNSLKFTNVNTPQIKIVCKEENGIVKFSISDNGIGISEKDFNKVFEIFRRLNTSKDYPGTGIGLAICKKIVDRHSGKIWPESIPGNGTTFYFTLNEEKKQKLPA